MSNINPRQTHRSRRKALRDRVAARGEPCAICGKPIDYSLTTYVDPIDGVTKRHPLSYELDEIVPVSRGGDPLDPDNVQPTHRICNQKKGNGTTSARAFDPAECQFPTSRHW